ncbi:disulfide bond formation protein DsbA [Pseudomonas protegens]|jgi:protein-disulfide isomerase|uniref:Thioredoxin domain protein, DsbA family n=2 Tax=Pseudomonas protegens TaxID=380021 RepID=Q4K7J2_PSEF5|nr:DsbA family protein [Pseudomonas protegens]AAY96289.1 thioredoxin domain protein, DsbA family [Pseudomonas protegens Pf-5]ASE21885.1 disulfide bond formation protein DsbA [Pseudomonas protegens]QEZ54430.1 disulfide bond formation protein DsbA [Pseudomonas protegens]QEZ59365.1 disulfide bond formation protein DsbA [Pseudomonas protegens]QEZ65717.1 disulfide bond formation protein DsbA [Pseudomonas protegens]
MSAKRKDIVLFAVIVSVALITFVAIPVVYLSKSKPPGGLSKGQESSWLYGKSDARWTITEYADLECPYCRTYTPQLMQWIDGQTDVNLVWHHFPLQMHGAATLKEARLVQCAGKLGGGKAFWNAIDQVLKHTRGDGQGLVTSIALSGIDAVVLDRCATLDADVALHVDQQLQLAQQAGVTATPTIKITDTQTRHSVRLEGPVDEVSILSAMDRLAFESK